MRLMLCTAIVSALAAGSALAAQAPAAAGAPAPARDAAAKPSRTVYICDESQLTRRAFERRFGTQEFVKAEEAAAKGEAWAAPKCITAAEARKLKRELATK